MNDEKNIHRLLILLLIIVTISLSTVTTPVSAALQNLSRRDAILLGTATTGLYGKLAFDVLDRVDTKRPLDHERRASATFGLTLREASASATSFNPQKQTEENGTLKVLELGIGNNCRSVFRGYYDDIRWDDATMSSSSTSRELRRPREVMLFGVDLNIPTESVVRDAKERLNTNENDDVKWNFDVVRGDVCAGLPTFPTGYFDAVTCCLALCSVSDQRSALDEIKRLVKPKGGCFGWLEHVAVAESDEGRAFLGWQQQFFDPAQQVLADNCHLHRYTSEEIMHAFGVENGGASILEKERFFVDRMWPVSCQCRGVLLRT